MGEAATHRLNWSLAFRLGRVSNLPTVWTNVLAGLVLSGSAFSWSLFAFLALAFSLFYVAGMYLNDAFDRDVDARERPERPIPSGAVSASTVFGMGFLLLVLGWLLLVTVGSARASGSGWSAGLVGAALAAAILLYDMWHKGNPVSPLLMGLCRLLVYAGAAVAATTSLQREVVIAALTALCYLIGLTYAAKQERLTRMRSLWPLAFLAVPAIYAILVATTGLAGLLIGTAFLAWLVYALSMLIMPKRRDVPRAVVSLIAGICLLDAAFVVHAGHVEWAGAALAAFMLTLTLQRRIAGT